MKKILAVIASAVLATGLLFAEDAGERSVHAIGFDVPVMSQSWNKTEDGKERYINSSGVGFTFMYHHLKVSPNRFSSFINVEMGYAGFEPKETKYDGTTTTIKGEYTKSYDGFIERFSFGLGGAPVNIDRFILALHGTFGVNGWYGTRKLSFTAYDREDWAFSLWTTIGFNIDAAVKLGDHVGLFAGTNFYTDLLGFAINGWEDKYTSKSDKDAKGYVVYPGTFNVDFRFGVAFVF